MASMLVAALEEAERERDLSVKREPTSAELAAAAWSKLQYDFPVVSPAELDALAKEMEAEAGRSTAPPPAGAALAYAPTNPLVAAVIEGASRTPADAAADDACAPGLRRAFQRLCAVVLVRVPARLAKADTLDELARADAFLSRYRAAARDDDELRASGVSRDAFPDDFPSSSSASDEGETEEARAKSADDDAPPPSAAADPDADSDASDWEPLEPEARGADAPVPRFGRDVGVGGGDASEGYANDESARIDGPETRRTRVSRKLVDLLERARYAYFDAEERARSSMSSASSAWALSGVGNAAADLVERACSDDSNANAPFDDGSATRACGDRALALLIERWRVAGVGAADGADVNALRRCLRALGVFDGNDASKARRRRARAGARTLGTLCAPFVLFAGAGEAADEGSRADEERRARALWPIAAEALAPVARTLDEALADRKDAAAVRAARGGACATETERLETLAAACCATIAFYASRAPGNASVGTDLLKSGALRAAAATFAALEGACERRDAERGEERSEASEREASSASALASEAARRCLLLASAASPESAAFALAVPGVRRAIEMRRAFASPGGTRAAHGALWALVSPARLDAGNETRRASDSDGSVVAEFAGLADDRGMTAFSVLPRNAKVRIVPATVVELHSSWETLICTVSCSASLVLFAWTY